LQSPFGLVKEHVYKFWGSTPSGLLHYHGCTAVNEKFLTCT
jgi:hypothetical protein